MLLLLTVGVLTTLELILVYFDIRIFCNFVSSMMMFFGPIFWQEKNKTWQRFDPGTFSI